MTRRGRTTLLAAAAFIAAAVPLAFVVVPLVSIFARAGADTIVAGVRSPVALEALAVSLRTSVLAIALVVGVGTPVAYVLGTRRGRVTAAVETLLELPLVLPPPVAGLGLLIAFGRAGLIGRPLGALGVTVPFTQIAVVLALTFVAMPFYVRQAAASFAAVDDELIAASRTLGAGPARTLARVAVPVARPGLVAGVGLAWARALGEFGATLMFAGSLRGRTQTLPVAIYAEFQRDVDSALAISALLVVVSVALLVAVKLVLRERRAGVWVRW